MLNNLLTALNDCVWAFDVNTQKFIFLSPRISALTGYTPEDFQQNAVLWKSIVDPRDCEDVLAAHHIPSDGKWLEQTYRIVGKNNEVKWINHKTSLITDLETGHEVLLSVINDISDQRNAATAALQLLGNFGLLFNNNSDPMWIYELPTLRILKVNEAAIKHYGYSEQEWLSMTIRDIRPRFDLAKFNDYMYQKGFAENNAPGFNNAGVWKHLNKKGEIVYAEITGHEIKHGDQNCRIIIAHDVTRKVLQQEDMKRREKFLTSLIESQTNFLIRIDARGNFTFVNKWFLKTLGYKKADIIGKNFSVTAIPEEAKLCEDAFNNSIVNPGKVVSLLHRKLGREGKIHWVSWEFTAIAGEDGQAAEIQGIGQDVTRNIESEKEIKAASDRLNSFIESITDYCFILNHELQIVKVNSAFKKLVRLPREQIIGRLLWDCFPNIPKGAFEAAYSKALNSQTSVTFVEYAKSADKWFNVTIYPSPEGLTGFIRDITEERRAQEETVWTKNNLEALINNTEDFTWSINREGRYVYMNTAYRNRIAYTIGISPKEGDDAYEHSGHTEQINQEWRSYYQRAFLGERYVTRHESPDPVTKELSYFEVSFNPIYKKSKNEIIGVGCFARDITERLKTEKALIEQNERLRNIASLSSHELRRPVASMIGLLNILDRQNFKNPENEQIIDHLFTVSHEIDEVIRLIVNKTFIDDRHPL